MAQLFNSEVTVIAGVQPVGTIVYSDPKLNYKEVVIASDLSNKKQVIHCKDQVNPLFRVEWTDARGYEHNRGFARRDHAFLCYSEH